MSASGFDRGCHRDTRPTQDGQGDATRLHLLLFHKIHESLHRQLSAAFLADIQNAVTGETGVVPAHHDREEFEIPSHADAVCAKFHEAVVGHPGIENDHAIGDGIDAWEKF